MPTNIIGTLILLLLVVGACSNETEEALATRPNIIVILCDDLGYNDLGFMGSKDIPTPNLDALAHNGTIFSSAYVAHPFCGPSRTSLMTGRYAHKMGAQFNLAPNSKGAEEGIPLNEVFISKVLKNAGYRTGIIGKWHLGTADKFHPNNRGFDEFYGFLGGGHKYRPEEFQAQYDKQKGVGEGEVWEYLQPLEYNGKEVKETEYLTDGLSREAIKFTNNAAQSTDPFFLYLSYNAPHTPLEGKKEDLVLFEGIKDDKRKNYAAMVYAVDRGVGKLVTELKKNNQFDNTLIVFLSDNGGKTIAGANNFPLREGKGSTCEGGFRVPMFFHWPKHVASGQINANPISSMDLYPTFTHLAQAKIPVGKELDGKNIWDDFSKGQNSYKDQNIYVLRHREGYSDVGIRRNEWKALLTDQNRWKLFKITDDIGESHDLADKHPVILKELVEDAKGWSSTNIQPLWWHDEATGVQWKKDGMPHFDETFNID